MKDLRNGREEAFWMDTEVVWGMMLNDGKQRSKLHHSALEAVKICQLKMLMSSSISLITSCHCPSECLVLARLFDNLAGVNLTLKSRCMSRSNRFSEQLLFNRGELKTI
jgi:hypothetical protein